MADFIRLEELAELSGFTTRSIQHMHADRPGPLTPILTKFGHRLGCWRADWEKFKAGQLKLAGGGNNQGSDSNNAAT